MRAKICGITNKADALHAVSSGATYLGMIFVESSPRAVKDITLAAEICAATREAHVVGVFQNQTAEEITDIVSLSGLDIIQLHGGEEPAFCRMLGKRLNKPVIKVLTISVDDRSENQYNLLKEKISSYGPTGKNISYLLFDRPKGDKHPDWLASALSVILRLQDDLPDMPPYFFAGGLNPQNVGDTLSKLKAYGVDVASGVERSPGEKDPQLVSAFIKEAMRTKS